MLSLMSEIKKSEHPELISIATTEKVRSQSLPVLSANQLIAWKKRVYRHQQGILNEKSQQMTMFNLVPSPYDAKTLAPFQLKRYSINFWQFDGWQWDGECCLYFVIDSELPILLYIGETKNAPRERWQNHYCQEYLQRYQALHYSYQLERAANIAFLWDVPRKDRPRKKLEAELIALWKSPFNKENWEHFGQPFKRYGT